MRILTYTKELKKRLDADTEVTPNLRVAIDLAKNKNGENSTVFAIYNKDSRVIVEARYIWIITYGTFGPEVRDNLSELKVSPSTKGDKDIVKHMNEEFKDYKKAGRTFIVDIETIKEDLIDFGKRHNASKECLETIKGNTLTELFDNITEYIYWFKNSNKKEIEFNSIFDNDLVIENDVLLCDCSNENTITIPYSVRTIGDYAFYNCSKLTSIRISNSVTAIGDFAFSGCSKLKTAEISNSVTSISDFAFADCKRLTSIKLSNSVTVIGNSAFRFCSKLTSIEIPDSVTSIGEYAFRNCSGLTSIELPNSVTSIGNYAFYNCSKLTSVKIPDSVTYIGDYAFRNCNKLTGVAIPDSVTHFGDYVF